MAGSRLRAPATASGSVGLLAAWCLLSAGDALHEGEYTPVGLACVVLGFAVAVAVVAGGWAMRPVTRRDLVLPAAVAVGFAVFHPATHLMHVSGGRLLATQLLAAATALALVGSLLAAGNQQKWWAWLVGSLGAVTGVVTILVVTDPHIDVWFLLQQSSTGLLHGDDMYRQHWVHSTGLQAIYPYLPGTTVVLAPFRWVLGDVRYGLLLAVLVAAYLVRRLDRAAPVALAGLLLAMPHFTFLIDQSWTEPLLVAALAGAVLALRERRSTAAMLCLAAALACKQHIVLLLPVFAMWPGFGLRRTAQSCGLAALVILPWVVAGPHDIWHDAVHANLALGVLRRALCLPSLFSRWGFTVGFWFPLLGIVATYLLVWRRMPRTPAGLALSCALVMWALDLTNKQSFFNHYTLPMGLLVVAVAAADRVPVTPPTTSPQPTTEAALA